jgi:general secretion pathway protein C
MSNRFESLTLWSKSAGQKIRAGLGRILPQDLAQKIPQHWDPSSLADFASQAFQKKGAAITGKVLTIGLSSWFLADVTALLGDQFIPEPPMSRPAFSRGTENFGADHSLESYSAIWGRNLFNSQGLIPGDDSGPQDPGGPPIRTQLPFNLVGTLVLKDELRSLATIEDRSASQVYPVRVEDEIPSKAKIIKVEPTRVIFLNLESGRREFVELPEELMDAGPRITVGRPAGASAGPGVERTGNSFNVSRLEVDKALADFNQVLTQARAVPNFENGVANGYKLFQIVPGSIYDKLGLKNGDVILGLNGEAINDPAKAFELLGQLKSGAPQMDLSIRRDGRTQNYNYNFR